MNAEIIIERSPKAVWAYFTEPGNWDKWWGGELKTAQWREGGKLEWAKGGSSSIEAITPGRMVQIDSRWFSQTFTFEPKGNGKTIVRIQEGLPKAGASFSDGGASHLAQLNSYLIKLKEHIENETNLDTEGEKSKAEYICPHCGFELQGDALTTVKVSVQVGVVDFQTTCSSCGRAIKKTDIESPSKRNVMPSATEKKTTLTSGFTFSFPEVKKAYNTNIQRKLSSKGLRTILGGSLLTTTIVGISVYFLQVGLENLINFVPTSWPVMAIAYRSAAFIAFALIVGVGSFIVGNSVGKSAIKAKFPNAQTIGNLALVLGLVGYLSYLIMYVLFSNASERFDQWDDYLLQAVYLVAFVGIAWWASRLKVEGTPFCEKCNEFMVSDDIGVQSPAGNQGLDIAQVSTIMYILNSRQFSKLNELNKSWSKDNYCLLHIWHCPLCNNDGFIDCTTHESRIIVTSQGETKTEYTSRLIYSSHIDNKEIQTLLQARRTLGTPTV